MGYEPGAWSYSPALATSQEDYDRGFALHTLAPFKKEPITYGMGLQVSEKQNFQRPSSDEGILTWPAHDCPFVLDLKVPERQGTATADQSPESHPSTSPTDSLGYDAQDRYGLSDADFAPEDFPDDIGDVVRVVDLSSRLGQLRF
jgi:hypothetical protein